MKMGENAIAIALMLTACGGGKATDDLKAPPPGGYSSVPEEKTSDVSDVSDAGTVSLSDYVLSGEAVIKDLRQSLVQCNEPGTKGYVVGSEMILLEPGKDGRVASAVTESRTGLTEEIDACLRRVAMKAEFAPPPQTSQKITFRLPVDFFRVPLKARHH